MIKGRGCREDVEGKGDDKGNGEDVEGKRDDKGKGGCEGKGMIKGSVSIACCRVIGIGIVCHHIGVACPGRMLLSPCHMVVLWRCHIIVLCPHPVHHCSWLGRRWEGGAYCVV